MLSGIFVGYDRALWELTRRAFLFNAVAFLLKGFNIFGSSFFTALNNGLVSAAISFLRTLLFQSAAVLLLPMVLGLDGVWLSVVVAEVLAGVVTAACFVRFRGRYHY